MVCRYQVVIMASDGLWEFLSNEEVIQIWEQNDHDPSRAMAAMIQESGAAASLPPHQ